MATGVVLAMLPDFDVIGFKFGVAYADVWGHRGASHALAAAVVVGGLLALLVTRWRHFWAFCFLAFAIASHGLLDALTSGGLGPALFWPFDEARYFAPVRSIRVSPIGAGFFSWRGAETLWSEFLWVWLPLGVGVLGVRMGLKNHPSPHA